MAEGGQNERQGLFKSSKTQAKYGTTSKVISANESFIKHIVKSDETLQGIALKYSCTVSNHNPPLTELSQKNNLSCDHKSINRGGYILPG